LKNESLTPEERTQTLQLMLRHCASLSKRIGDLFELSKLDAGRMQPKLEVFCLAELLQDIVDGYQIEARGRQVALTLSASSQSAACVRADIALMERVFQNLIDNALRHTPAGGAVSIAVTPGPGDLRVSVADTGKGIAAEHLAHVFERYYQAEDPESIGAGPSAGLGLAIVKRILELHGSAIRVSSEIACGTRFDFSLPRAA
jgi:signal transduction histidine kinase